MSVNSFEHYELTWKPSLSKTSLRPKYLELASKLEEDIHSKRLKALTRLPPQRELADFLEIDFTTVTRAYDLCREKGLIYGVVGRGTFVASEIEEKSSRALELGVVEAFPELGVKEIVEATKRVIERGDAARLFGYGAREGKARAKEAARLWLKREGIEVKDGNIAIFPGTQSALSVISLSLFQPGDKIAVDEFTYANFIKLAQIAHLRLVAIKGDKNGMLPSELDKAAAKEEIKGVYLQSSHANPTGITMGISRRKSLAKIIKHRSMLVIEDSAALFEKDFLIPSFFSLIPENVIHLSSPARFLASGLRIAFVAFPERYAIKLISALHHMAIKASSLDAEILAELILSGADKKILAAKKAELGKVNAIFDSVFMKGEAGFFRTIPIKDIGRTGEEIEREFLCLGLRLCHSDRFAVRRQSERKFLRVSLSSCDSSEELEAALKRVCLASRQNNLV